VSTPSIGLRCGVAVLALGSALLHAAAAAGSAASPAGPLLLLAMGLACLPCALRTVLLPTRRAWAAAAAVPAAMLALHPLLPAVHVHAGGALAAGALVAVPAAALLLALCGLVRTGRAPRGA
jgi:hypothetical protein